MNIFDTLNIFNFQVPVLNIFHYEVLIIYLFFKYLYNIFNFEVPNRFNYEVFN